MRPHEKHGCAGATSSCRPWIVLFLLALGAAIAWALRCRHVAGIAEADEWRQALPEWSGPTGTSAETAAPRAEGAAPAAAPSEGAGAVAAAEPPASSAPTDDLRRIEGIGPKIAAALVAADLGTYTAVADASIGDLKAALKDAGMRFAPSLTTWAQQARLLADGDEAGFAALTDRLVAGRDEG